MSQRLIDKYRQRLAGESGLAANPWGGRLSVALVYPNTYHHGMSNLGLQAVYQLLNRRPDTRCERFFLPDPEDLAEHRRTGFPLLSLETQRPLADFDLVAFSVSFENDYLNLPAIFELAQLPLWRAERDHRHPLVLCGGVCAFLNPEPLAEIMDLFAVGEAEVLLDPLLAVLQQGEDRPRPQLLTALAGLPGIYVPSLYQCAYNGDGTLRAMNPLPGAPQHVERQWLPELDAFLARTCVATPETEFGGMQLVEVSRGCPRACRFCAAGFIYRPFREHSPGALRRELGGASLAPLRIGLVAAAVSDYDDLAELGSAVLAVGGEISVSSVRIDAVTPQQVEVLARSGHKTLALAPEAGSQRMRDVVNKGIDEAQILAAVQLIAAGGIPNLKLYFMVGLPGESDEDVLAIGALAGRIRQVWEEVGRRRGRLGRLTLSVNPFVPKPWTPLQWAPMAQLPRLEQKYRLLQRMIGPLANVDLQSESLRSAQIQGLLARGDRRCGRVLPPLAAGRGLRAACREVGIAPAFFLNRERGRNELFPWEIITQGIRRDYLWHEYQAALHATPGQVCHPGCRRCGMSC
jgi:radical SAM superfamily enzyme YgiQ (UPF0313 family)